MGRERGLSAPRAAEGTAFRPSLPSGFMPMVRLVCETNLPTAEDGSKSPDRSHATPPSGTRLCSPGALPSLGGLGSDAAQRMQVYLTQACRGKMCEESKTVTQFPESLHMAIRELLGPHLNFKVFESWGSPDEEKFFGLSCCLLLLSFGFWGKSHVPRGQP